MIIIKLLYTMRDTCATDANAPVVGLVLAGPWLHSRGENWLCGSSAAAPARPRRRWCPSPVSALDGGALIVRLDLPPGAGVNFAVGYTQTYSRNSYESCTGNGCWTNT